MKSFEAEDVKKQAPTHDAEEMSCEEISNIINQYNDKNTTTTKECPQCEDTTEAYDSLVCEYKKVERCMIDQVTQIENIGNENHCITLINYLEMNKRRAQMNHKNILIDDCNIVIDENNRVVNEYKIFHAEAKAHIKTLLALLDNANERCNKKANEYDDIMKQYRELQEKYVREKKERERKEFRWNRSRYRSWENES